MPEINNGSGAGLREFLERAAAKGDLNPSTVHGLKAAVSKILEIDDELDQADVRNLDVDTLLERFATLQRSQYTPGSMKSYQSRFRTAVAMYTAWLNNDPNWRKIVKTRSLAERTTQPGNKLSSAPPAQDALTFPDAVTPQNVVTPARVADEDYAKAHDRSKPPVVTYQLPLRPDLIVELTLPVELTPGDAARVANFVRSLAFEDASTGSPRVRAENEE